MKLTESKLREIIKEELNEIGLGFVPDPNLGRNFASDKRDTNAKITTFYQKFSSPEAKKVVDGSLKQYAKILRQAQYKIIKDWMSAAKSGAIDYFALRNYGHLYEGFIRGNVALGNNLSSMMQD